MFEEYRCPHCKKLFFKGNIKYATIEIKCKNCKNIITIQGKNCKVWLLIDKKETHKKNNNFHEDKYEIFKNAIIQCESCNKKKGCKSHQIIKEKNNVLYVKGI